MFDPFSSLFCTLCLLTSPAIEQSLSNLESPNFHTRKRAEEYLRSNGIPYAMRILIEYERPSTLDKKKRVESILICHNRCFYAQVGEYFDKLWQTEGDLADLMFGNDWPPIDVYTKGQFFGGFFYKYANSEDLVWHSHRHVCADKKRIDFDAYNKHSEVWKDWYYGSLYDVRSNKYESQKIRSEILMMKRFKYALELENNRWPMYKATTKVWAIEAIKSGEHPLAITLVLTEMRRREKLQTELRSNYHVQCVRDYPNWINIAPFVTIHGKDISQVPNQFVMNNWLDEE